MAIGGDTSHRSPQARQCLEEELAGLREREDLLWVDERINEIVVRLAGSEPLRDAADLPDGTVVTLRFEDGTVTARLARAGWAPAGHRPGDTITYATPEGRAHTTLLDVRPPAGGWACLPSGAEYRRRLRPVGVTHRMAVTRHADLQGKQM